MVMDIFIVGPNKSSLCEVADLGDVSNLADLDRLYDMVKQQKGRIDVLVANAGNLMIVTAITVTAV